VPARPFPADRTAPARAVFLRSIAAPAVLLAAACAARAAEPPPRPGQIAAAIEKAADWLLAEQKADGSWECRMRTDETRVGASSLVMLALLNAGVPADAPAMQRGLDWLRRQEPRDTYSVSLQTMVLAATAAGRDLVIVERNVRFLEESQINRGPGSGSWSYGPGRATGDNSNSQFAVLALHEAERAGVRVREQVWGRAHQYWTACANGDGSWGYTLTLGGTGRVQGSSGGSGSMTCAGISSLWITAEHTGSPAARAAGDEVRCCGGGSSPRELEKGLEWLGRNFSVTQNPGTRGATWLYYYLYGLERVGRFTARRFIGDHDWYLEGSRFFLSVQDPLTGSFRSGGGQIEDPVIATSFATLFLAKGRRPVIVAKSRHLPDDDWNRHAHDLARLVDHVERLWKKDHPAGLSWHVVDTRAAKTEDLLQSPVLWISGREAFEAGADAARTLRRYLDEGGFIFAEACCPASDAFDGRFRALVAEIFPEPDYRLHLLPPEHPAWHAEEIVPAESQRPLLGVDYGCRTAIVYAPPFRDDGRDVPSLSCLWELADGGLEARPESLRKEVAAALAIGTNVLAYATNRELKSKDDLFAVRPEANAESRVPFDRGHMAIGKLRHAGLCDAAPAALSNILRAAARELGMRVDAAPVQVDPADPAVLDYHLLFMHGRQGFELDPAGREQIRRFLEAGGTLLVDSVCASQGFSDAFRREMAAILPEAPLEPVPVDDPIFSASEYGGFDIREVALREPSRGDGPLESRTRRTAPKLEAAKLADRWAVIFSPYDLSCALEKQYTLECTGYERADAERIALNVVLYSLHH
jgi:hypothetical protein